jgi:hypothetical protein
LELQLIIVKYLQKIKENRNEVHLHWQRHVVGGKGKMKCVMVWLGVINQWKKRGKKEKLFS